MVYRDGNGDEYIGRHVDVHGSLETVRGGFAGIAKPRFFMVV